MSDVKWIKITSDIFDDDKILLIESMPDADALIVIWFKLLCLAGKQNNSGVFTMNDRIPYTEEMLATIFRRPLNTVRLALDTFESFGMINRIDGVITIPNWEKHQSIDQLEKIKEQTRNRVAQHRLRQKELVCNATSNVTVTECNAIEEIREDKKRIDKSREEDEPKACIDYQKIITSFNEICVSYPQVKSLSDARKKAIRARLNTYSEAQLIEAFEMAESADFLKGKNNRNWQANFDWLMKDTNLAKVLDGNYTNSTPQPTQTQSLYDKWMNA